MAITKYGTNSEQQESAFYCDGSGATVAWGMEGCDYYVVGAGEMRIHFTDPDGNKKIITHTDDLLDLGITTDEKLDKMTDLGDDVWYWDNNNWFEVYSNTDFDYFSDPIYTLDEAVKLALELAKIDISSNVGEEPNIVY